MGLGLGKFICPTTSTVHYFSIYTNMYHDALVPMGSFLQDCGFSTMLRKASSCSGLPFVSFPGFIAFHRYTTFFTLCKFHMPFHTNSSVPSKLVGQWSWAAWQIRSLRVLVCPFEGFIGFVHNLSFPTNPLEQISSCPVYPFECSLSVPSIYLFLLLFFSRSPRMSWASSISILFARCICSTNLLD